MSREDLIREIKKKLVALKKTTSLAKGGESFAISGRERQYVWSWLRSIKRRRADDPEIQDLLQGVSIINKPLDFGQMRNGPMLHSRRDLKDLHREARS